MGPCIITVLCLYIKKEKNPNLFNFLAASSSRTHFQFWVLQLEEISSTGRIIIYLLYLLVGGGEVGFLFLLFKLPGGNNIKVLLTASRLYYRYDAINR